MIDPCTLRDTSAPQRSHVFKWTQAPRSALCQDVLWSTYLFLPTDCVPLTPTSSGSMPIAPDQLGKIKLRCQIRDLKSEVTVYVIDADTSYNLLLGRPWIHRNHIVPSTLHQVMKYMDNQSQVHTLVAERHPFKGVETQ